MEGSDRSRVALSRRVVVAPAYLCSDDVNVSPLVSRRAVRAFMRQALRRHGSASMDKRTCLYFAAVSSSLQMQHALSLMTGSSPTSLSPPARSILPPNLDPKPATSGPMNSSVHNDACWISSFHNMQYGRLVLQRCYLALHAVWPGLKIWPLNSTINSTNPTHPWKDADSPCTFFPRLIVGRTHVAMRSITCLSCGKSHFPSLGWHAIIALGTGLLQESEWRALSEFFILTGSSAKH